MDYEGDIIRPPSEAHSLILQVTTGCSHNSCTFCGAYRDKKFRIKEEELIGADLEFARNYCQKYKTVFLADGNGLAVPQDKLLGLLARIKKAMPQVRRVSLYANCQDILSRSAEELQQLREAGLGRIYMGLESGHDPTLKKIGKGADAGMMIRAGQMVREARMFLSATVLLGVGGEKLSIEHAQATAEVLNAMQPNQVAVLTLLLLPNTPLARMEAAGRFKLPTQKGLFRELRTLVAHLKPFKSQFQANHPSNYFTLDGRLPRDRQNFLDRIDMALSGGIPLVPEQLRAL